MKRYITDARLETMIQRQISARGINNEKLIEAFRRVPRNIFVPDNYKTEAFSDRPLPIGYGQTISQPYIVAFMTQLCDLKGNEKVLEIGSGCGYQSAILAVLAGEVHSLEIVEELHHYAKKNIQKLHIKNIKFYHKNGYLGLPEESPFDIIILTAAPPKLPEVLVDQISDNGKIIGPIGSGWQNIKIYEKQNKDIVSRDVLPVRFVPMVNDI